jgi:heme-degrading monooxygenase HmoA
MTLYSVGIWTVRPGSEDEFVARWRSTPEWQWAVAEMRGLLEHFEPGTYDLAATRGP